MKTLFVILTFIVCCGFACNHEDDCVSFRIGEETIFMHGVEYCSNDLAFRFQIADIQESRCPEGLICVWQGEVTVKLEVEAAIDYEVILKSHNQPVDTVGNYKFSLIEVTPYPKYKQPVELSDYRVTLKIERLN
jgi:hypothetical protein